MNGMDRKQMVRQNVTVQVFMSTLHLQQRRYPLHILATRLKTTIYFFKKPKIEISLNNSEHMFKTIFLRL